MKESGWRKGRETKKLLTAIFCPARVKAQSIEETMKFIYDEADHIIGTIKGIRETGTGKMPKPLTMVQVDARAIQRHAKQVMNQITKIESNRRELFINCCEVLEGKR